MDELALLERFRSDVEIDATALIRARRRVVRRALVNAPGRRRRYLLVTAAAAALAVAVTLVGAVGNGPTATPAAAAVLARAADSASSGREPAPGQYLHVRKVTTRWYDDGRETTVQERWIPGDGGEPRTYRDFEGDVYQDASPVPAIYSRRGLSTEALLTWLRRPSGDLRGDDAAYERVGEVLASDLAPVDFQAGLFDAMQHLEGVTVVDQDARFDAAAAVIIGRGGPLETQFAFDETSGQFIGMQGVGDPENGTPLSYKTSRTTDVVNGLPRRAGGDR
ncbi:hypothetical protein [Nocardioides aurantiacus]|uniref:CU044_5270 family protein n=1 Tax=Nocardioides aurantiacus TaxID=86796 RepID=A0A3N2CTN9_9ACTN|nr:hypothetical protein [Nocardioides aurantiacus]ROR90897.1 hypothetical protein EDD33_1746 [Nocardioides aurantiacus]